MKRLIVLGCLLAVVASVYGQAVYSRNAVGYVKITVPAEGIMLCKLDFEAVGAPIGGGSITVSNLIGDQLPNFSSVFLWNATNQAYDIAGKTRTGVWAPNLPVRRGQAFWLRSASNAPVDVFFLGEVPSEYVSGDTYTNFIMPGLTMSGFPFPVSMKFTNTSLYADSQNFDNIMIWDGVAYEIYGRTRTGAWAPSTVTNLVLEPGQGFWYKTERVARYDWIEGKPYQWP